MSKVIGMDEATKRAYAASRAIHDAGDGCLALASLLQEDDTPSRELRVALIAAAASILDADAQLRRRLLVIR